MKHLYDVICEGILNVNTQDVTDNVKEVQHATEKLLSIIYDDAVECLSGLFSSVRKTLWICTYTRILELAINDDSDTSAKLQIDAVEKFIDMIMEDVEKKTNNVFGAYKQKGTDHIYIYNKIKYPDFKEPIWGVGDYINKANYVATIKRVEGSTTGYGKFKVSRVKILFNAINELEGSEKMLMKLYKKMYKKK